MKHALKIVVCAVALLIGSTSAIQASTPNNDKPGQGEKLTLPKNFSQILLRRTASLYTVLTQKITKALLPYIAQFCGVPCWQSIRGMTLSYPVQVAAIGDDCIILTPHPRTLVVTKAQIWNMKKQTLVQTLQLDPQKKYNAFKLQGRDLLSVMCYSPGVDQNQFTNYRSSVEIWSTVYGKRVKAIPAEQALTCQPLSDNIVATITGGPICEIRLWDINTKACVRTITHTQRTLRLCGLPSQRLAVLYVPDATVKIWDTATGACIRTLEKEKENSSLCGALAALSHDTLAVGWGKKIKLCNVTSGLCLRTLHINLEDPDDQIFDIVPLSRNYLALLSVCGIVQIWNTEHGENIHTFPTTTPTHGYPQYLIALDKLLIVSDTTGLKIWEKSQSPFLDIDVNYSRQPATPNSSSSSTSSTSSTFPSL